MAKWKVAAAAIVAVAGIAYASGGWDDGKSKAEEAKRKADEARKQWVQGEKKTVGAMCNARDFDSLKDAGRSAAGDARSDVRDKVEDFHRSAKDAIDILDHIDSKDSHHSDAQSLESDLKRLRDKLDEDTRKFADGSPDYIIDPMVRAVDYAKSDRRGRCSQKEFSADGERIDCMIKDSDTCYVIVTTLDNSNAISSARDRARRGAEHIKSEMKRSSPAREVNGCVHVEARVDCVKACPEVGDDGRVSDPRASWRERCD